MRKCPDSLIQILIVPGPDRKTRGVATSATSKTRVPERSSSWEVYLKEGGQKEEQASIGTMYEKTKDIRMHQKGQAFV